MYSSNNVCLSFMHLFMKHPILIIGLGLFGAVSFVNSRLDNQPIESIESDSLFVSMISELNTNETNRFLAGTMQSTFNHIVTAEAKIASGICEEDVISFFDSIVQYGKQGQWPGVHPDGVSYGPAGLTKIALKDVLNSLNFCESVGLEEILNNPEYSTYYAYVYFLTLVNKYKNLKTAIIAYNIGTTRVDRLLSQNKSLPTAYYNSVMKFK